MLAKFKRDYTVFLPNNEEFTFEKGYSYLLGNLSINCVTVASLDGKIIIDLNYEETAKYIEKIYSSNIVIKGEDRND